MRQPTSKLRHLAVLIFIPLSNALPEPAPHPQVVGGGPGRSGNNPAPAPVKPWVSVNPQGGATTITPSVFTTNGVRTTTNTPPGNLAATGTYTLYPSGTGRPEFAVTTTALAPVASATGTNDESGFFLACDRGQGTDEPFCLPKRGSILHPGRTYYVTWSTTFFNPPNISIAFQAHYHPSNTGFTTHYFPADRGFYPWEIPDDFLSSTSESLNVTLSLVYEDTETPNPNDIRSLDGPTVFISPDPNAEQPGSQDGGNGGEGGGGDKSYAVAIAIPIVVLILLFGLAGFCFFKWKRNGVLPLVGTLRRRSTGAGAGGSAGGGGGGYGERQSRAQRVGSGIRFGASDDKEIGVDATTRGVELTDRDSWSPTGTHAPGRNVFREEIRRQESQRQG